MVNATRDQLQQLSDFEIRLLKVFQAVVDCGGFAAAEAQLGIGRSTISVHIANLETRLNLKLCRRGRAGFALTEDGEEVYALMQQLFVSMESFRSGVNALHAELSGELKIIVSDAISLHQAAFMPELIRRFSEQAPGVTLSLDVGGMTAIEEMVLNNKAHVGFVHLHQRHDSLHYEVLYKNRCYLYCSEQHPLFNAQGEALASGVRQSKLAYSGLRSSAEISAQLADLNKAAVSYFYEARLALIYSGAYIGFLPEFFVEEHVKAGRLRALQAETRFYDLSVATIARRLGKGNRARDKFLEIVQQIHQEPRPR